MPRQKTADRNPLQPDPLSSTPPHLHAPDVFDSQGFGGYALNVIQIPRLRSLGFLLIAAGIVVHNLVFLQEFSLESTALIVSVFVGYSLLTWLVLYFFFERFKLFDLAGFFLAFDIFMLAVAVYLSGGERSMLFFLMVMRVVDQAHTNFARLLVLTHLSLVTYMGLVVYLDVVEGRELSWAAEASKIFFVYGTCIYIALTSRRALKNRSLRLFRLSKQLHEKSRQLSEANRAKSLFLANMSHELRTPLNSIIGFANVLLKRRKGELSPGDASLLEPIVSNGTHLLNLINDILDFTRIETTGIPVERTKVDLAALLRETVGQFASVMVEEKVALVLEVPESSLLVKTDERMLRQVLINLISNALKFTDQGSVTVRAVTGPEGTPERIDVVDTGIGIPPDRHNAIFEAFQQAEGGTTRKYGGTGLGLAISRSLCGMMGYRLEVQSKPGQGSTFSIHFAGA